MEFHNNKYLEMSYQVLRVKMKTIGQVFSEICY